MAYNLTWTTTEMNEIGPELVQCIADGHTHTHTHTHTQLDKYIFDFRRYSNNRMYFLFQFPPSIQRHRHMVRNHHHTDIRHHILQHQTLHIRHYRMPRRIPLLSIVTILHRRMERPLIIAFCSE